VNPNATITLTSAPATTNQSLCINTAINNITYSIGGGGTGAGVVGLPTGVNGVYAAGVFTISGTPTVSGPLIIQLLPQELAFRRRLQGHHSEPKCYDHLNIGSGNNKPVALYQYSYHKYHVFDRWRRNRRWCHRFANRCERSLRCRCVYNQWTPTVTGTFNTP